MSEVAAHHTQAVDPAAIEPTTMATEATSDPIRPTGTDTLVLESRPELANSTDVNDITPAAVTALPPAEPVDGKASSTEAAPVTEGVLGYKAPGLIKSFRFSKRYFWLSNEPVDHKSLATYLGSEKAEVSHPTGAHASQTGKGLLFFAKRSEDKSQPAGILNLSHASDFISEDLKDFSFKLHGQHKYTFQAATKAERDSWLSAVEAAAAEAKSAHESVVGSDGYKSHMSKFAPAAAPAVAASKSTSVPPKKTTEDKVHDGTLDNSVVAAGTATEAAPKTDAKSRSQSRKRQSIFGKVLGKKEDTEEKKEIKKEEKAEKKEEKAEIKAEEKAEKAELKADKREADHGDAAVGGAETFSAAAIAARVMGEPVVNTEGSTTEASIVPPTEAATTGVAGPSTTATETAPKPVKRGSVFGSFFGKKDGISPSTERKEKDIVPAVPAKDTEASPAADAVPVVGDVDSPIAAEEATPTVPEPAAAPTTTAAATSPSESKSGIFGFLKQKEAQRDVKKEEKKEIKAEEKSEAPVSATGTPTALGSGTPAPVAATEVTPTESAMKEKRRQSFFGSKKEKKADGSTESGKLGGLFRKASRSANGPSGPVTDSSAPPAPIAKDVPTTTDGAATIEPTSTAMVNGIEHEKEAEPVEPESAAASHPAAIEASA